MRNTSSLTALIFLFALSCNVQKQEVDLILSNGLIYTVDEAFSTAEALAVKDSATKEPLLYILAGRQIITSENLEVCALATTWTQEDKSAGTIDTIHNVRRGGGLAALNWAPGKWFGDRGKVVKTVFDTYSPNDLSLHNPLLFVLMPIVVVNRRRLFLLP